MVKANPLRFSQNGGEWSALMEGRVDHQRYPTAMRRMRNCIGIAQGPSIRRPAFEFIKHAHDETKKSALIPFIFTEDQALVLEFSDERMRILSGSGVQVYTPVSLTDVVTVSPFKFTSAALAAMSPTPVVGQQVVLSGLPASENMEGVVGVIDIIAGNDFTVTLPFQTYTGATGAKAGVTVALVYEIETPYLEADLNNIFALQDIDVVRLYCPGYRNYELARNGAYEWAITETVYKDGPYLPEDIDLAPILTPSATGNAATGGTATSSGDGATTAAADAFDNDYDTYWESNASQTGWIRYQFGAGKIIEGYVIYASKKNDDGASPTYSNKLWRPSTWQFRGSLDGIAWVTLDEQFDYQLWNNYRTQYIKVNTGGVAYPYYEVLIKNCEGEGNDIFPRIARIVMREAGTVSLNLTLSSVTRVNEGQGWLTTDIGRQIRVRQQDGFWRALTMTARTNSTVSTWKLQGDPLYSVEPARRWRFGYFSDTTGWPRTATFFKDRIALGGITEYPNLVVLSRPSQYDQMSPTEPNGDVVDDNAIAIRPQSRRASMVRWLVADSKRLVCGSGDREFTIEVATANLPFSARNVEHNPQTRRGSSASFPVEVDHQILFTQGHEKTLREFAETGDGFRSPSMSIFTQHIGSRKIKQIVYAAEPHSIVWVRLGDGGLASFVYNRDEQALGWQTHPISGGASAEIESMCVIPDADTKQDTLWAIIKRTIDGNVRRNIERMAPWWDFDFVLDDARFVDSWQLAVPAAATTDVYNLLRLEGQRVHGLADGQRWGVGEDVVTVLNGHITVPEYEDYCVVGQAYLTEGEISRIEAGAKLGTAQGKLKRINDVMLLLWQSFSGEIGTWNGDTKLQQWDRIDYTGDGEELHDLQLYDGMFGPVLDGAGHAIEGTIAYRTDDVLPFNVVSLMPRMDVQEGE